MKKMIENNKLILIIYIILFIWISSASYQFYQNIYRGEKEFSEKIEESCKIDSSTKPWCREKKELARADAFTNYYQIFAGNLSGLMFIGPAVVIIPAILKFHRELKSGYYKNILTRMSYKKYLKKSYLSSLKYILILPAISIFLFFLMFLISGHFDVMNTIKESPGIVSIPDQYLEKIPQFLFTYFLNMLIMGVVYVNLAYIFCKNNVHILVSSLSAYISLFVINMVGTVGIGGFLLARLFNIHYTTLYFEILDIWEYSSYKNVWISSLYYSFLAILTLWFVTYTYRSKESVVIENEK